MKWMEVDVLPPECGACMEKDCYHCDHAGKRWILSEKEELLLRRKMLLRAVERQQQEISRIDERVRVLDD